MSSGVPNLHHLLATLNETLAAKSQTQQQWSQPQTNLHPSGSLPGQASTQNNTTRPQSSQTTTYDPKDHSPIPLRNNSTLSPNPNHNGFPPIPNQDAQNATSGVSRIVSTPQPPSNLASTPAPAIVPDASLITTWPAALKHMNKHIIPNEKLTAKIKHLISQQHKHEREWWTQRQAIVNRHAGRSDNQDKAAELLKSLGVVSTPPVVRVNDKAADEQELKDFDRKVHRALGDMARDYDAQMRKMGVPGFAVKRELVVKDDEMVTESNGAGDAGKGKIDKGELRELQRKVLEHLEDSLVD